MWTASCTANWASDSEQQLMLTRVICCPPVCENWPRLRLWTTKLHPTFHLHTGKEIIWWTYPLSKTTKWCMHRQTLRYIFQYMSKYFCVPRELGYFQQDSYWNTCWLKLTSSLYWFDILFQPLECFSFRMQTLLPDRKVEMSSENRRVTYSVHNE